MKKKIKILVLVHPDLIPPQNVPNKKIFNQVLIPWKTEFDVISTLKSMGHEVLILGVDDNLNDLNSVLDSIKIDLVFNLVEQYKGKSELDFKVIEFLEKRNIPFTGCNSRTLILGKDKAISKKIVMKSGIKVPKFKVFRRNRKINISKINVKYPLIVKCLNEESSYGIAKKSVVRNDKCLLDRIQYIHENLGVDCIVEEFIEGDEIYISSMGGESGVILPPRKLYFPKSKSPQKEIYTAMAKWSYSYAKREKIFTRHFSGGDLLIKKLEQTTRDICRLLSADGPGRVDYRINKNGEIYFLEFNPNPNLAKDDDFSKAAIRVFSTYESILEIIMKESFKRNVLTQEKSSNVA